MPNVGYADGIERPITSFPNELPALTSSRFVFALGVVLFHYSLQWPWDSAAATWWFNKARLGVDAFFILSGFVLTHAYRSVIETKSLHYGRFVVARLARIYPAHLTVIIFVMLMVSGASIAEEDFDRSYYEPAGLVLTLLLLQSWGPDFVRAEWNGPSWSLSAEWFAYLAFPVFAAVGFALRKRPVALLVASGVMFLFVDAAYIAAFGTTVVHAEVKFGILRIIPEFLFGVALYRLGERLHLPKRAAVLAATAAGALFVLLMHFGADDRIIVAAAGPLLLALALLSKAKTDKAFAHPWLLSAGEASYALYLVHMPILIGWKGLRAALSGQPSSYTLSPGEVPALLILTLGAAFALHFVVERPARDFIRKVADRKWPVTSSSRTPAGSQPPDV